MWIIPQAPSFITVFVIFLRWTSYKRELPILLISYEILLSFICQGGDVKSTPIRRTGDLKPSSIAVISVRIVERLLDGGLLSFCGMTEVGDKHQLKFRDSCTCFSTGTTIRRNHNLVCIPNYPKCWLQIILDIDFKLSLYYTSNYPRKGVLND